MQHFTPFEQHRVVRNFLRQHVLEDVLYFWESRLFVEKLFVLERREEAIKLVFSLLNDVTDESQWEFSPNYGKLLEQSFFVGCKTINA